MHDFSPPVRMLLSMQMLADALEELSLEHRLQPEGDEPRLRGCQLYCGQHNLQEDLVYLLPGEARDFPADTYCYLTTGSLRGRAPHIRCVGCSDSRLFNAVLSVFQQYHDFEQQLSAIVTGGGTLDDLCRLSSAFFHNPVYIHDSMFTVLAMSHRVEGMLKPEYNEQSGQCLVPLDLINDFKFDESYRSTLEQRQASVWDGGQSRHRLRSLYVNLLDDGHYRGRLLINELSTPLQPGQFRTAEYLAAYVMLILRRDEQRPNPHSHSFDDTFADLLSTGQADRHDLETMLDILDWNAGDRYLCLKFRSQDSGIAVRSDSALRGILAGLLQHCASFYFQQQLCAVVNLTRSRQSPHAIRLRLAPHIRDSYMFGGISSPVCGIHALPDGFRQTELALQAAARRGQWLLSFSDCALDYIQHCAEARLPPSLLAAPVLLELRQYDGSHGTRYYETLRAYLLHERSIPRTAEALIIHRTTLTYRLGKLEELWSLNLDDSDTRLYLLLSFRMLDAGREP